jgi:hypothetical protein
MPLSAIDIDWDRVFIVLLPNVLLISFSSGKTC